MKYETISALRISLYDCVDVSETPAGILKPYIPNKYKNRAWIPQTMGDQIWVLFEFEDAIQRDTWEKSLPANISNFLDRKLIPHALDFGWGVRNMNGFIIK